MGVAHALQNIANSIRQMLGQIHAVLKQADDIDDQQCPLGQLFENRKSISVFSVSLLEHPQPLAQNLSGILIAARVIVESDCLDQELPRKQEVTGKPLKKSTTKRLFCRTPVDSMQGARINFRHLAILKTTRSHR